MADWSVFWMLVLGFVWLIGLTVLAEFWLDEQERHF